MQFAERMSQVQASGIRAFFDKGQRMRDAIDLSIGQADFDVPEPIKEATICAVRGQCGRYSVTQGYPELLEATRAHLKHTVGLADDEALMMTTGASGAIAAALFSLAGPGDEVVLPDPYFVVYRHQVHLTGATPVYYDMYPDFRLRAEAIERCLTDRTRLVILNSPANPTGAVSSATDLKEVADLCRRRGVPVLSDELYSLFTYDGEHTSIKRFLGPEALLVGGFSKSYGMAGWRLAYAAGAPELIDRMRTVQQFLYVCPPTLVQRGALAAFDVDMSPRVREYRAKRDLVHSGLAEAGYEVTRPAGSFFIFPRVPGGGEDLEFCERALEHRLIIVPGRSFSRSTDRFRISFSNKTEVLERGIEVLRQLAR